MDWKKYNEEQEAKFNQDMEKLNKAYGALYDISKIMDNLEV